MTNTRFEQDVIVAVAFYCAPRQSRNESAVARRLRLARQSRLSTWLLAVSRCEVEGHKPNLDTITEASWTCARCGAVSETVPQPVQEEVP